MKKITLLTLASIFIISCSQSDMQGQQEKPIVEYVWHNAGPDFNAENLAKLINEWNVVITESGMDMLGANILTPSQSNDGFDFIWVMRWPSMSARNAGWDWWNSSGAQDNWAESINGIMSFSIENVYPFEVTDVAQPRVESNTGSFLNRFHFCNFNDGSDSTSLKEFKNAVDSTIWSDTYWNVLLNPLFDADPKSDFVWLDLWADQSDKDSTLGKFMDSEYANMYVDSFTCNTADFSGVVIR
ncbi:hypothetical protein N8965_02285 [Gammaproteobacteria bacterium]|nr:hypothetical protein [Gammaproteobacteria bacterium]